MPDFKQLAVRLTTGAVAGAVATWSMRKVTDLLESNRDVDTTVDEAFADHQAPEDALIDQLTKRLGVKMSAGERHRAHVGLKWALGITNGVATAWARRRVGAADSLARGALFGAATFLVVDEILMPAIGARRRPGRVPWQTHGRGLAAHTTYGLVNAGVRQAIRRQLTDH